MLVVGVTVVVWPLFPLVVVLGGQRAHAVAAQLALSLLNRVLLPVAQVSLLGRCIKPPAVEALLVPPLLPVARLTLGFFASAARLDVLWEPIARGVPGTLFLLRWLLLAVRGRLG